MTRGMRGDFHRSEGGTLGGREAPGSVALISAMSPAALLPPPPPTGPAQHHPDHRLFCLSLLDLAQADRAAGCGDAHLGWNRGPHWLFPAPSFTQGPGAGERGPYGEICSCVNGGKSFSLLGFLGGQHIICSASRACCWNAPKAKELVDKARLSAGKTCFGVCCMWWLLCSGDLARNLHSGLQLGSFFCFLEFCFIITC